MKNKKVKLFKIYFIIFFLSILIIILLNSILKYGFIYWETRNKYFSLKEKINKEERKIKELKKKEEKLNFSSEINKNILENYMLKRPGEKVIQIIE